MIPITTNTPFSNLFSFIAVGAVALAIFPSTATIQKKKHSQICFIRNRIKDYSAPTFAITVDARFGTSTGVSASDRAKKVLAVASPDSKPNDFRPTSVLSAVIDPDDGSMASLSALRKLAIVEGNIGDGQDVLVRVHSECLTGDVFGSARCDCGNQLDLAMQLIEKARRGVVVYLRGQKGRDIGLGHKLQDYNLQDLGHDTVEANLELRLAVDSREYGISAQILRDLGVRTMRLMTNNPAKCTGLKGYGLAVVGRVPVLTPITEENKRYLEAKRTKMGHIYGSDIQGPLSGFVDPDTFGTEDTA
ncbi:putative monofunctional riboflavin biosynthesis protein RIBA 3, chloroplastic [Drosera capensis]